MSGKERKKGADKQLWVFFPLEGDVFQTAIPFTYFFWVRPPQFFPIFFAGIVLILRLWLYFQALNEMWGTRIFQFQSFLCNRCCFPCSDWQLWSLQHLKGEMQGPFPSWQDPQCASHSCVLPVSRLPSNHAAGSPKCRVLTGLMWERCGLDGLVTQSVGKWALTSGKKLVEKGCEVRSVRNGAEGTFRMVMFQVKLSTAFCSLRSFRPSLVPMLCRCSWNSMAERSRKTKDVTPPPNLRQWASNIYFSRYS